MSPRTFLGWLVVTVATVVLALVIGLERETATFNTVERGPVFEDLRTDPDAPARVVVRSRFDEIEMVREDGRWISPQRDGYPVEGGDVRRLIAGLADMRFIERKTSNPERFKRLEVQDIEEEFSDSAHVTVYGADGGELADVIVGRPSARFFEGRSSGTYIRFPGTDEVWLVSGVTNVQTRLVPWLARGIVGIPANAISRITLGEGETAVVLERSSADSDFAMVNIPEGRSLDQDRVRTVSRALADVELEDVVPVGKVELPADAHYAEIETFEGLRLSMRMAEIDRKRWAVFEAEGQGEAAETAAGINDRVADWVYWVPSAVFENLTRTADDLLTDAENQS